MLRFDFALKYVAGKSMEQANSLSRRTDWVEDIETVKKGMVRD